MIQLGTALKCMEAPYHRCVVISDPQANGGQIVLVRVTTDDGTWPDRDCLLGPSDWAQLEHPSTVAYSTCKYGPALKSLDAAIVNGLFVEIPSPPPDVLRRIIAIARRAEGMPPGARRWLPDETESLPETSASIDS